MKVTYFLKNHHLYRDDDCYWVEIDLDEIDRVLENQQDLVIFCNKLNQLKEMDKNDNNLIKENKVFFVVSKDLKYFYYHWYYYTYSHMLGAYSPFVGILKDRLVLFTI